MHSRRLACLLLGLWLGGGLFMEWVSRVNLLAVDRLLAEPSPGASLRIKTLGKDQAYLLLRYQANERNRYDYEIWEIVQVVLSTFFFFFLLFATTEGKFSLSLALLLMVFVVGQRFILTPEIRAVGRLLDFGSPVQLAGDSAKFHVMHYTYTAIEVCKWLIQLLLAGILIGRGRLRSSETRQPVTVTAKASRYDR
jgi:hypothetical protein